MFAVIQTGGKQYPVSEGSVVRIEKLPNVEKGGTVSFDQVLLVSDDDAKSVQVGKPHVDGAVVRATVMHQGRHRKTLVRKFKAKVRYRRTYGHRQPFTEVRVDAIEIAR